MNIPERAFTFYPGVTFDEGSATVGEFVIIGVPPRGHAPGAVVVGNPARIVRAVEDIAAYRRVAAND